MQFRGQLKLPGQSTSGVSVDLRVDDIFLELHSNGEMLGRWRLDDVSVERVVSNEFNLIFDDERLLFLADDALAFAYEGLTTIEQVSAKLRKKRRRSRGAGDSMRGLLRRLGADRSDSGQTPTAPPPPEVSAEQPSEEPVLNGPPPPAPPPLAFLDAIGRSATPAAESSAAAISQVEEPTADDAAPAAAVTAEPPATTPAAPVVVWDVEVPAVSYAVDFETVTRRRSSRTQPPAVAAGSDEGSDVATAQELVREPTPQAAASDQLPAPTEAPAEEPAAATQPQPEEELPVGEPSGEETTPEEDAIPPAASEENPAPEASPSGDPPAPAELPRRTVAASTPAPVSPAPSRTRTPSEEPPRRTMRTSDVPVVPAATAPAPELEEPQPPWVIPEVSDDAPLPLPPEPEVFVEVEPPAASPAQETEDPVGEEHPRRHLSLVRWEDADEPEAELAVGQVAPPAPATSTAPPPVPAPAAAPAGGGEHPEVDGNGRRKGGLLGGLFGRSKPEQHTHQFRESRTVGGIIRRVCTVCGHVSFDGEDIYTES